MARYEVVRKIENECERNQMRDVLFDEIETDDPVAYVRAFVRDGSAEIMTDAERPTEAADLTVFAKVDGLTQVFSFSRI